MFKLKGRKPIFEILWDTRLQSSPTVLKGQFQHVHNFFWWNYSFTQTFCKLLLIQDDTFAYSTLSTVFEQSFWNFSHTVQILKYAHSFLKCKTVMPVWVSSRQMASWWNRTDVVAWTWLRGHFKCPLGRYPCNYANSPHNG